MNKAVKIVLISLVSLVGLTAAAGGVGYYLLSETTTHVKNQETISPSKALADSFKRGCSKITEEGVVDFYFNTVTLEKMLNYQIAEKLGGVKDTYEIAGFTFTDFFLEEKNENILFSASVQKGPLKTIAQTPLYFSFSKEGIKVDYSNTWTIGKIDLEYNFDLGIDLSFNFKEDSILQAVFTKTKFEPYYENGKIGAKIDLSKFLDSSVKNLNYVGFNSSYLWSHSSATYDSKNHTLSIFGEDLNGFIMNDFYQNIYKNIEVEEFYNFKTTDLFFDFENETFYYGINLDGLETHLKYNLDTSFTETEIVFTLSGASINNNSSGKFISKINEIIGTDEIRIPYSSLSSNFNSYSINGGTVSGSNLILSAVRK